MTRPDDTLTRPMSELQRYAGWLGKDRVAFAVRADVLAFDAAMKGGRETSLLLLTLEQDIQRLPGGAVRKMLRKTVGEIRAVLEPELPS